MYNEQLDLEQQLGSFDPSEREYALGKLHEMLNAAQVSAVPELPAVNLHCHTFFSFNAYGYSPSAYAWEAKKRGLYAAGIVDFDVLDGVEEFLCKAEDSGKNRVHALLDGQEEEIRETAKGYSDLFGKGGLR